MITSACIESIESAEIFHSQGKVRQLIHDVGSGSEYFFIESPSLQVRLPSGSAFKDIQQAGA